MSDDSDRYVEYHQRSLMPEGWDSVFDADAVQAWVRSNTDRLRESAARLGRTDVDSLVREHAKVIEAFKPSTRFDEPYSNGIFGPLLDEVRTAASEIGLRPTREVRLATSTALEASPRSLPTTGEHLLLVGPGSSHFCNYWAKTYAAVVRSVGALSQDVVTSSEQLDAAFARDASGILLATRLALYEAVCGTTLGFGVVAQPRDYAPYRLELLRAMELFVVAHEYSHFVAHERLGELDPHDLETFCDEMALQLSRHCAQASWLAFTGAGAVAFLRSAELVLDARQIMATAGISGPPAPPSDSHPPPATRVAAIKSWVEAKTATDQRAAARAFVDEFDRIATFLNARVVGFLRSGAGVA